MNDDTPTPTPLIETVRELYRIHNRVSVEAAEHARFRADAEATCRRLADELRRNGVTEERIAELMPEPAGKDYLDAALAAEKETRAWTRGFFSALRWHSEGRSREDGIESTALRSVGEAVAAGAEDDDAQAMREAFEAVRARQDAAEARRARRATDERGRP